MGITIFGSYNGTSIGDTAILLGLLHGIAQVAPNERVTVLTMGPLDLARDLSLTGLLRPPRLVRANIYAPAEWSLLRSIWWRLARLGLPLNTPFNYSRVCSILTDQDLLIIGGGNLLMDLFPNAVDLIENITHAAQETDTPYCFAGLGVGPIARASSEAQLASCLAAAQHVVVRDLPSQDLCVSTLHYTATECAPDLAFALPARENHAAQRLSLAVNPAAVGASTWPVKDAQGYQLYLDGMSRLVLRAVEKINPHCIEIIITNPAVDQCAAQDLAQRLAAQTPLPVLIPVLRDVTDILDAFGRAKLAIITRLHAGIMAALATAPVLPIAYQSKVRAVLGEAGIAEQALALADLQTTDHDLDPALALAIEHGARLRNETRTEALAAIRKLLSSRSRGHLHNPIS